MSSYLTLIPLFQNAAVLALASCMFGLGMGVGQPIITMLMFSRSVEGLSGEALGLRMPVNHLTKMIGRVVFGYIASALVVTDVLDQRADDREA